MDFKDLTGIVQFKLEMAKGELGETVLKTLKTIVPKALTKLDKGQDLTSTEMWAVGLAYGIASSK